MLLARASRQVTSEECQREIFYFEKMEADDYRNDPLLAEACRLDVEQFCEDVEPGAAPCWDAAPSVQH